MPRTGNVFYNLVTDENSTTELLCNLLRFDEFRLPFLRLFLSEATASEVSWGDIDTQGGLFNCGIPDLRIENDKLLVLLEVKVTPHLELTSHQSKSYLEYLSKNPKPECLLVFLVPSEWNHLDALDILRNASSSEEAPKIHVVHWERIVEIIEQNELGVLNPILNEFGELITGRIAPKPVAFLQKEVSMLFSKDIPTALSNLERLIAGIQGRSTYKMRTSKASLCGEEYGIYFLNSQGKDVFWFGIWMPFWKEHGIPLCFGVADARGDAVGRAFRDTYKGKTKHFKNYNVGWITQEVLAEKNAIEKIWFQLAPVIDAVVKAGSEA
jgi:hypothetical protein